MIVSNRLRTKFYPESLARSYTNIAKGLSVGRIAGGSRYGGDHRLSHAPGQAGILREASDGKQENIGRIRLSSPSRVAEDLLTSQLREVYKTGVVQLVPPHLVRSHVMEVCNMDTRRYPLISCGNDPKLSLVGIGLPTMMAFLFHKSLPIALNTWPIVTFASGTAYTGIVQGLPTPQREVFSIFIVMRGHDEWLEVQAQFREILCNSLSATPLQHSVDFKKLHDTELHFNECSATSIVIGNRGKEIGRISYHGSFISHRVHMIVAHMDGKLFKDLNFPHLAFLEIDLSALAGDAQ